MEYKIRKKLNFYEFWELDGGFVFWTNFLISFISIQLIHMKLKHSKNENEFGEIHKELTEKKKNAKKEIRLNMKEYAKKNGIKLKSD
jgi:hypothetical protein